MAWNIAAMTGAAFVGKLKSYSETFPPNEEEKEAATGLSRDGAHLLGALFRLRSRGVSMTIEKITRH